MVLGVHLLALLTPGPDFLLISSYALKTRSAHAFKAVLGVVPDNFVWIVLSLFGLKGLFAAFPLLQTLLVLSGACYLLYLAFCA
ncbi:LysE family transporter [Helicobacter sp. NHP22-001]|uniref:LysE family transporter n=1 Tax=Helicobacter sp. NHP22-001 TaxID=3040202 RepID=UPI00255278EA|nr:LysE family transporter [Helicobacter sp. NHP22-001]